jgi:zinc transport system ATP-binding protein
MVAQTETSAQASGNTAVVTTHGVYFSYGGAYVLEDVNIAVNQRDFACIVGPNGGGKTTLLKLMLGLISPTRGSVYVFGHTPNGVARRIGYVPQYTLFDPSFPITVMDIVLMGRLGRKPHIGPFRRADKDVVMRVLNEMGVGDLYRRPFGALSGGQRQRVLIARALAAEPELLLLDEPTANLDARVEQELLDLLGALNRKLTIVMVSHDIAFVSAYVKSVICVRRRVVTHPTSAITGDVISEIYGGKVKIVRHDGHLEEEERDWVPS